MNMSLMQVIVIKTHINHYILLQTCFAQTVFQETKIFIKQALYTHFRP